MCTDVADAASSHFINNLSFKSDLWMIKLAVVASRVSMVDVVKKLPVLLYLKMVRSTYSYILGSCKMNLHFIFSFFFLVVF